MGYTHPQHFYTEEDYETMKTYWRNEKIRGGETLYWEDVNIGDEPTPTCEPPQYGGVIVRNMAFWDLYRFADGGIREELLQGGGRSVRNEQGLYELPMTERVWKLFLLFQLYTAFTFTGHTEKVAKAISPDQQERLIINSIPVKLSHLVQNIVNFLLPTIAGALFVEGIRDRDMFRYLLPPFFIASAVIMFISLHGIKERIPAPPIEEKEYFSFWTCVGGILKNKYLWINKLVELLDSLGNGMLNVQTILLIYTWRETGLIFSVSELVFKFAGTPGQFLAPWIRKRFEYKTLRIFEQIANIIRSVIYIVAILFLGKMHWACGILLFIGLFINNAMTSAIGIAKDDMKTRISDYQMYISGERFEGYQELIGWFTKPITSMVGLIIPLIFVSIGFTSDWDVLYMDDVRLKCMLIGILFDLAGFVLMMLPFIFFWDFTDEKHVEIMKVLQERAGAHSEEAASPSYEAESESISALQNTT